MNTKLFFAMAAVYCLSTPLRTNAQIKSSFNVAAENWKVVDLYPNGHPYPSEMLLPVHSFTNGNPNGHIWAADHAVTNLITGLEETNSVYFFFQAPEEFLGDNARYYGGVLSFDVRRSANLLAGMVAPEVVLVGNGITLMVDLGSGPTPNVWWRYSVQLDPSAGWRVNNLMNGDPANPSEIQTVLGNLEAIRIRGEFSRRRGDTCALDNVTLCGSNQSDDLSIVRSDALVLISWSNLACHQILEYAESFSSPQVWHEDGTTPTVEGGRLYVTNTVSGTSRFYRLK